MHITVRNVNQAFGSLVSGIYEGKIPTTRVPSRNGDVLKIEEPVLLTYTHPRERVLFNVARDCNPFFHVFESLWMLAGRQDVAPLKYYVKTMDQFSDDGVTFNGAYGYRWRRADTSVEERDQLAILIEHLRDKPESRRAVLQMWNVEDDLMQINESKDVCCNLSVMFALRRENPDLAERQRQEGLTDQQVADLWGKEARTYLDMTVTNRSNDMILGMLGANLVHFSFLQEYVACALGVEVGVYNQFTNNLHVYTWNWEPEKWLEEIDKNRRTMRSPPMYRYADGPHSTDGVQTCGGPLLKDVNQFDMEVKLFVEYNSSNEHPALRADLNWKEPFLQFVVQPMMHAFHMHKHRDYEAALHWCDRIQSEDWQLVCGNWLDKRWKNYLAKGN